MSLGQLIGMMDEAARRQNNGKDNKPMNIETFERLKSKADEMDARRKKANADR